VYVCIKIKINGNGNNRTSRSRTKGKGGRLNSADSYTPQPLALEIDWDMESEHNSTSILRVHIILSPPFQNVRLRKVKNKGREHSSAIQPICVRSTQLELWEQTRTFHQHRHQHQNQCRDSDHSQQRLQLSARRVEEIYEK